MHRTPYWVHPTPLRTGGLDCASMVALRLDETRRSPTGSTLPTIDCWESLDAPSWLPAGSCRPTRGGGWVEQIEVLR